jgi:hypothetical protein
MTNAAFKLEDSGFSREQVDALSEFMDGSVATKADIAELSGEIKEVRGELKADIERLDGKITAEIAGLNGKITAEIAELNGKITAEIAGLNGRINLVYWMLGVSVAGIVSLVIKAFTAS